MPFAEQQWVFQEMVKVIAEADERLALAFRGAIHRGADPKGLMESQRVWVHDARDICNDVECMLNAYEERISDLDSR